MRALAAILALAMLAGCSTRHVSLKDVEPSKPVERRWP
jgi:uncharacterized lipoprotein YajG